MSTVAMLEPPEQTAQNAAITELSIIMPCLNEAETLEICIRKAQAFLERHGVNGEVVIGDNGSTDGSQEIARRCGARVEDVKVRGYGAALYHATLAAHGKYVIMGDSDDSYDFSDLMPLLTELRAGRDLVVGNRFKGGATSETQSSAAWADCSLSAPSATFIVVCAVTRSRRSGAWTCKRPAWSSPRKWSSRRRFYA